MKILFTGASSFTGLWFSEELALAGHALTCAFPRHRAEYSGLRQERMEKTVAFSTPVFACPFGSPAFLELARSTSWDLLCHHAAAVTDYKSPDFDVAKAVANNTHQLKEVLRALKEKGCRKILLTGSVFEQREGQGTDDLRAVSPYGLSKGLTSDMFHYYCGISGFHLGKFVIPNPFGPFEESRFTTFLAQSWLEHNTPMVASPDYVRDNIHVSLLAKAYSLFAESLSGTCTFRPCGYQESQGAFTRRFSAAMETRWGMPCPFEIGTQTAFPEPRIRLNTDPLDMKALAWEETLAWDDLAHYYRRRYAP